MIKNDLSPAYWPGSYTYNAIGAAIVANVLVLAFFGTQAFAPFWLLMNLIVLSLFFIGVNITSVRALNNRKTDYTWKLFWMAFGARLLFMTAIVMLAEVTWGQSFYVGAVDATRYHRVATEVAMIIANGDFNNIFPHLLIEYSGHFDNIGVPLVLGFVYTFFGMSPIVAKIFIALMGTGTVVLVYKTTRLIWDESVARLAGILMAFFPLALFYSSVILKEEFVVFLSMLVIYILVKSAKNKKIGISLLLLLISALVTIFLFRTAAGALLVTLVAGTYILNRFGGSYIFAMFTSVAILGLFFYFLDVFAEIDHYVERVSGVTEYSEARVQSVQSGNDLANIVGIPVYVVLSFIAPFPSMVATELRFNFDHDATYYWVSGLIIWNFLIYFGLVGLWKTLKTDFRESLPVWGFAAGYTIILGITALFTSVRFGYNAMPAFFILMALGIHHRREFPYWKLYLIGMVGLIFAWNFFRLAGRGAL